MTRQELEAITPESVLSEFHIAMLTPYAVKVYLAVWRIMAERSQTAVQASDEVISIKARVPMRLIAAARSELSHAGLLELTPDDKEVLYRYVESEESAH
jgi:hypothetical protein